MCTVTFIPGKDKYFITSNRDEKLARKPGVPPQIYQANNKSLVYPKDTDAGGSWIAMCDNGNAAVLLNGAFNKHISTPPYQRSRGLVFTEIIAANIPVNCFRNLDLTLVEPFTIVLLDQDYLYICKWDGSRKYHRRLAPTCPYIWSSVTLYDEEIIQKRERWFAQWLTTLQEPDQEDILHFHQFAGEGDTTNDLRMNRNNHMLTVSITGMELSRHKGIMRYKDIKTDKEYIHELSVLTALTSS